LPKTVVVSFEGDKVNIIYATRTKNSFVVDAAVTVADAAFDDFLAKEKTRTFIVVNSFTQFFCDTFSVPPAKDALIRPIIENEIRKISKMQHFAFIHAVLGERVLEQKKTKEVFAFAVETEHIRRIVDRFTARGKVIEALYPDIFALAGFVGAGGDTVLGVLETATNKHLFIVKDGQILFVRVVQAFERGMRDHDMRNITMTVNYCRQNLKLNPQRIVLIGHLCRDFYVKTNIGIPMVSFTHPAFSRQIRGRYAGVDYMLPIAALFVDKNTGIDLLPGEHKTLFRIDRALRYGTGLFCMLLVVMFFQAGVILKEISDLYGDIKTMRRNLPDISLTLQQYGARSEAFNAYRPLLAAYRRYASLPDAYMLLRKLADLPAANMRITAIVADAADSATAGAAPGENALDLTVRGMVQAEGFAEMQRQYEDFLAAVKTIPNLSVSQQTLDIKTGQLQIKGRYR